VIDIGGVGVFEAWVGANQPVGTRSRQGGGQGEHDELRVEIELDDDPECAEAHGDAGQNDNTYQAISKNDERGEGAQPLTVGLRKLTIHDGILAFTSSAVHECCLAPVRNFTRCMLP